MGSEEVSRDEEAEHGPPMWRVLFCTKARRGRSMMVGAGEELKGEQAGVHI